ncbi:MAG: hypothetical protein SPL54_04575, partial [Lachnospiraceae bacterium]|nr:hypothetical protein [Lachnospiraceae bacterium]
PSPGPHSTRVSHVPVDGLGIFRVAFLFVCQIAALVFHQRACRTGPFLCASPWETQLRHHIISWLLCQQFFNSFFVPALTDSSEVMSAAALLSGEADYNIGFFHLQQQISRILKL